MSCDEDYDDWEPVINVVDENKLLDIEIKAISLEELKAIENAATDAITQKLEKLNIILKNLNVYCNGNALLINDRYGICRDLEEIAPAFGFDVKKVDCGMKGKSYILQDALFDIICTINPQFSIEKYANCKVTADLISVIVNNAREYGFNAELFNIFQTIKTTGHYTIKGTQHITTTYEDGYMVDQKVGEVVSDEAALTSFLKAYMSRTSESLKKANENLRDGTVKLLYSRARQMGYAVKEERKGTQVQLVLVRNE